MKKIVLIPALLLLLVTSVMGLVSSTEGIVSECIVDEGPILTIVNDDSVVHAYSLSVKGSRFVGYGIGTFTLTPGESIDIPSVTTVPCGNSGVEKFSTTIIDDTGKKESIKQTMTVQKVQNIGLSAVEYSNVIEACDSASFSYDLANTGPFTETYTVSFDKEMGQYIGVSFNSKVLAPGETATLNFVIEPDCELFGNFTIPFKIKARSTGLIAQTEASLLIENPYEFRVIPGEAYYDGINTSFLEQDTGSIETLCLNGDYNIPIKIINDAELANTFYDNGDSFELEAGEEFVYDIGYIADSVGSESIEVYVESELGGLFSEFNISLDVVNCFDIDFVGDKKHIVDYEQQRIELEFVNTGSVDTDYDVIVDGPEWVSISPSLLSIDSDGSEIVHVISSPGDDKRGSYPVALTLVPVDSNVEYSQDITIKLVSMNALDKFWYGFVAPYAIFLVIALILLIVLIVLLVLLVKKKGKKVKTDKKVSKKISAMFWKKLAAILILIVFFVILYFAIYYFSPASIWNPYRFYISGGLLLLLILLCIPILLKGRVRSSKGSSSRKSEKDKRNALKAAQKAKEKKQKKEAKERIAKRKALEKERKAKSKAGVKHTTKKSVKPVKQIKLKISPKFWLWVIAIVVIAVIAAGIYFFWEDIISLLTIVGTVFFDYWIYFVYLIGVLLVILIVILLGILYRKSVRVWVPLKAPHTIIDFRKKRRFAIGELIVTVRDLYFKSGLWIRKVKNPTFITPGKAVYQFFEAKLKHLENSDLEGIGFRFKVKKSWLKRNNVRKRGISLKRYDNEWKGIRTIYVNEDRKYCYYEAAVKNLSFFAITGDAQDTKPLKIPGKFWWILLLVVLLLVVAWLLFLFGAELIAFILAYKWYILGILLLCILLAGVSILFMRYRKIFWIILALLIVLLIVIGLWMIPTPDSIDVPEPIEVPSDGIPNQIWAEDTSLTIDLGAYFNDPDNDSLVFEHTGLRNMKAEFFGSEVVVTPNKNWFGSEYIIFTARDGKGGSVDSNMVELTVVDVEEPAWYVQVWGWIVEFQTYIILGVALLCVLVLGLMGISEMKK